MSDQAMMRGELEELLSRYAGEHSSHMDRSWCRKRVLETYDALRKELAQAQEAYRQDMSEMQGAVESWRLDAASAREALASIATTGVTEDLLRAHDGFIKIGRGCVVVREDEYLAMRTKMAALEEKL